MRSILCALPLLLCGLGLGPANAQLSPEFTLKVPAKHITVSLVSEQSTIAPGEAFRVAVKLEHEADWHTYGKNPGETGLPNKVTWKLPPGWKTEELPWPATHSVPAPEPSKGYDGTVYLPYKLIPPASLEVGSKVKLEAAINGSVCKKDLCTMFKDSASIELPVAAKPIPNPGAGGAFESAGTAQPDGMLKLVLFGFLGGLILNIMPCVFPVLGIKITSVVHQAGENRRKILTHGLMYTLGVLVSFWTLAAVFQGLQAAGKTVGWGFQLQYPPFVFGIVLIMLVFGLNMAGVFEIGTSVVGVGGELQRKSGYGGSFFSGLLATVVATPCAAPLLANALPVALGLPLFPSLAFFSVIGLGLASPYLILSIFPSLLKLLPRPGAWMESFKQAMAFPMLGAAGFFVWVLMGLTSEESQRDLLIGLVFVALACWIYGRWSVPVKPRATQVKAVAVALLALVFGVWWAWPQQKENYWREWSPELVKILRANQKPVYVDFTARWCATCQVNHRVYNDKTLLDDFKRRNVVMLKADWTNPDDRIAGALGELQRAAVPVDVLYVPGRTDPVILPNTLTESNVKTALSELDNSPPKT